MDIVEINEHIRKLKCEETNWQSVEKLAALCTVRDELEEAHAPETQTQALPPATYAAAYSTAAEPQSDFVAAASSFRRSDAGARQTHERNKAGVPERV